MTANRDGREMVPARKRRLAASRCEYSAERTMYPFRRRMINESKGKQ